MIDIEAVKAKAKYMRMPLCELAEKIGYSEAGMYRAFSHGKFNVRLIVNISQVLGIELKDFVTDEKMLQSLISLNKPFAAANEKEGINNYEERMNKSYVERINALTDGLNAYHHQMEIKDGQLQKKDEQIDIFLKVLMQKDELIEELTKQVSSILEQNKTKDETLMVILNYCKSLGMDVKIPTK
jgi:adenylate kinase family enzyme